VVVVGVEPELVHVERLGAVDVGDGDDDELETKVHGCSLSGTEGGCVGDLSRAAASAWTLCAVATHSRVQESTSPVAMRSTTAKTSPRSGCHGLRPEGCG
jgi:hypothetical protein